MKVRLSIAGLLLLNLLPAAGPSIPAGVYRIDPNHSKVGFEVPHLIISTVEGRFNKFSGEITVGAETRIAAEIDAASVDTNMPKRDEELRGPEFFEVAKFPKITFTSTRVDYDGNNLKVAGNLKIRDVTRPVLLNGKFLGTLRDGKGDDKLAAQLSGKISRKTFGLRWNDLVEAAPVAGDEVTMQFRIEAARIRP